MIRVPNANERRVWAFEMAVFMEATNMINWTKIMKKRSTNTQHKRQDKQPTGR
jgi:hypothetical protein